MMKFWNINNLDKLNKETLVKIIHLFNHTSKKTIFEHVQELYEGANNDEKEIIESRINSIMSDINKIKFSKKITYATYSVYYYEKSIDVYPNTSYDSEDISEKIKQITYKHATVFAKNSKLNYEVSDLKSMEETIKKLKPENVKIKIYLE